MPIGWMKSNSRDQCFCCNFNSTISQLYYTTTSQPYKECKLGTLAMLTFHAKCYTINMTTKSNVPSTLHKLEMYGHNFKRKIFIEVVKTNKNH